MQPAWYFPDVLSHVEGHFGVQMITAHKKVREYYARLPQLRSEASGDALLMQGLWFAAGHRCPGCFVCADFRCQLCAPLCIVNFVSSKRSNPQPLEPLVRSALL